MDVRKISLPKISSDFKLIYDAATEDNLVALDMKKLCIDVRDNKGLFTPAAKLAAEGNDNAVDALAAYHPNKKFIAMGYASTGKVDQADKLRREDGVSLKCLAIGAAMQPNPIYAESLRLHYDLHLDWLVFGAAFAGRHEYLTKLIGIGLSKKNNRLPAVVIKQQEKMLRARMKGLIMGGRDDAAIMLLDAEKDSKSDVMLRVAIKAAARVANDELLQRLIVRNGHNPHYLEHYYQIAAKNAAKGGHIAYARELLNCTSASYRENSSYLPKLGEEKILEVVKAGLIYGHVNEVFKHFLDLIKRDKNYFLSPQISLSAFVKDHAELASLAASHGDLAIAEKIYSTNKYSAVNVVKAMDASGHFYNQQLLIHALAFIDNEEFLRALTAGAIELASDPVAKTSVRARTQGWTSKFENQCFTTFRECQVKASKINKLMKKYHFNFDQAQAFLESQALRSVLHFIAFKDASLLKIIPSLVPENMMLSAADMKDMANKYMLHMARSYVENELNEYISRNRIFSIYQHCNRARSLITDCQSADTREKLFSLIDFQHQLFMKGDIIAKNMNGPKHQQPLKNTGKDDFFDTIEKIENNFRLKT